MSIVRWNLKEAAKHWPDEQEADMRQGTWLSGHKYAKSETCTGTCQVDRPGINVKVVRITREGLPHRGRGDMPETAHNGMHLAFSPNS